MIDESRHALGLRSPMKVCIARQNVALLEAFDHRCLRATMSEPVNGCPEVVFQWISRQLGIMEFVAPENGPALSPKRIAGQSHLHISEGFQTVEHSGPARQEPPHGRL